MVWFFLRPDGSAPTSTTKKGSKEGIPVYEVTENQENPLRCPVKLYEFYLSKWSVEPPNTQLISQRWAVAVPCCFPLCSYWVYSSHMHAHTHTGTHMLLAVEKPCAFLQLLENAASTQKTRQACTVLADHLRYLYFIWYQFMCMCPVYVCVYVCSYASVWIKEIESMFSCADSTLCVMNEKVCSAVLTVHFVPWMKKYVQLWWQYTLCHEQNASNHHIGNS